MAETAQYEKRRAKVAAAAAKDRHLVALQRAARDWLGVQADQREVDLWASRGYRLAESLVVKRKIVGVAFDHQALGKIVMRVCRAIRAWEPPASE